MQVNEDESSAAADGRDRDRQGAERPAGLQCGRIFFEVFLWLLYGKVNEEVGAAAVAATAAGLFQTGDLNFVGSA